MPHDLIRRLRLQPEDLKGPSRMEMLRERAEAAEALEALNRRLAAAEGLIADEREALGSCVVQLRRIRDFVNTGLLRPDILQAIEKAEPFL